MRKEFSNESETESQDVVERESADFQRTEGPAIRHRRAS